MSYTDVTSVQQPTVGVNFLALYDCHLAPSRRSWGSLYGEASLEKTSFFFETPIETNF